MNTINQLGINGQDDPSSQAHTPGPWEARAGNYGKSDYYALVSTGAYRGDSCDGLVIDCEMSGENKEQDQANAHLIAAAPELLAALKLFMTLYPAAIAAMSDQWREQIEAAIAKAEGRS